MKFLSFLAVACLLSFSAVAQDVPNGGFEDWATYTGSGSSGSFNYDLPDFWKTTDSVSMANGPFQQSAIRETANVHGGSSALRLKTWPLNIPLPLNLPVPGVASNGSINTTTLSIIGGTPDTVRHRKLTGFYRFIKAGSDTASIVVGLYKYDTGTNTRKTVAAGTLKISDATAGTAYVSFDLDFNYIEGYKPDSMLMYIATGPLAINSGTVGTELWIDDLAFSGTVGIDELASPVKNLSVYPQPAARDLNVSFELERPLQLEARLLDLSGKLVLSQTLDANRVRLDVSLLPAGNYLLNLVDERGQAVSAKPVSIQR
jgi:hypothetical protein